MAILRRGAVQALFSLALCLPALAQQQPVPAAPPAAAPKDDGQWTMPAKNDAGTRYSELDEINTDNVKNLLGGRPRVERSRPARTRPQKGSANAMRDLKDVTTKGGTLYVFTLP
ncbi:hypothetical protein [Microvirga sp. M2]|uniref:hypothetical protein n=1 Tax=Microvirga sp. M2 TaxID=3073270 RepID=UPI0039C35BB6